MQFSEENTKNKDLFGEVVDVPRAKKKGTPVPRSFPPSESKNKGGPVYAEVTKILPHYSVIYAREISGFQGGRKSDMPKSNKPSAGISDKGARRLGSALNWMVLFSPMKHVYSRQENKHVKFKINFITLTIPYPQVHSDHYIKQRLLAPFLKWLERSWGVVSYVWKAEAQDNGDIHFHITTNQFVHWKSIRGKWNRLLAAHGYCKVFQDGTNDKGNAATSVKSVKTMAGIVSYLKGYITKKDLFKKRLSVMCPYPATDLEKLNYRQVTCMLEDSTLTKEYKRPIEGKLWSTSHNLSKIVCAIDMETDADYFDVRNDLMKDSRLIYSDKFIKIMTHRKLVKGTLHPSLHRKLREVWEKHFQHDVVQKTLEIESFY